jgi:hypothetical protein
MANRIELTIERSIRSNDWLRVATKRAQAKAAELNIEWIAADVFVFLPEAGRCFTKAAGEQGFTAHG